MVTGQNNYSTGARFSKVPKLFGRISGDEGVPRHETLQLFSFLSPLQHMKRSALQNKQVVILRMAFRVRKVLGTFEKRAPGLKMCMVVKVAKAF